MKAAPDVENRLGGDTVTFWREFTKSWGGRSTCRKEFEHRVSNAWTLRERHANTAWAPRRKLKWLHLSVRGQKQSCGAKNRRSRWQLRLIMAGKRCWHYSEHIKRLISLANRTLSYDYVGFWLQYKRAIEHVSNKSKCIPTSLFSARRCSFQCS